MILGLFCAAIYWLSRRALWESFDAELLKNLSVLQNEFEEEASENRSPSVRQSSGTASGSIPENLLRRAARETFSELRLVGISAEFRFGSHSEILLARSPANPEAPGAAAALAQGRLGARPDRPFFTSLGYRSVFRSIPSIGGYGPVTLVVVKDTGMVDRSLGLIRRSLAGVSLFGVLIALGGGYVLAYRALRPIDSLGRQAELLLGAGAVSAHRLQVANEADELGRLASVFNRLLEKLDAALLQMKRFVEDAAHELRSPVAVVRGEAELALSHDRGVTEYRDTLKTIARESVRLSRLVRDLTLLSEAEGTECRIECRLVDLGEVVAETVRALQGLAEARQVRLEVGGGDGVQCVGDEHLIHEILSNLIENAIKFSPEGSCARIELFSGASTSEIRVSDRAPTIGPSERERVFERFYRGAAARSGEIEGSGLGLAIVRCAAERHGGCVRIAPATPVGNVFIVELPAFTS